MNPKFLFLAKFAIFGLTEHKINIPFKISCKNRILYKYIPEIWETLGLIHRCTFFLSLFPQAQKKELDHIRQNYRKNSLARTPNQKLKDSKNMFDFGKPIDEDD